MWRALRTLGPRVGQTALLNGCQQLELQSGSLRGTVPPIFCMLQGQELAIGGKLSRQTESLHTAKSHEEKPLPPGMKHAKEYGAPGVHKFAVDVASKLSFTSSSPANIKVFYGEHSTIGLLVHDAHGKTAPEGYSISQEGSNIEVVERSSEGASGRPEITAWIPARFCGLDIDNGGGRVEIQGVTEAALRVESRGGDVKLGKVKGHEVVVHTGGGALKGDITAAKIHLKTDGGPVELKRLVGKRVVVLTRPLRASQSKGQSCELPAIATAPEDSKGGSVDVKSMYATHLTMLTGGGDIRCGTFDCGEGVASVCSNGGAIFIDGMDGNASLTSCGGDMKVALHDRVGSVAMSSAGGALLCSIAPTANAYVIMEAKNITVAPELSFQVGDAPPHPTRLAQRVGSSYSGRVAGKLVASAEAREGRLGVGPLGPDDNPLWMGDLDLDAGSGSGGRIELTAQSWMDGVKAGMAKKGHGPPI